MLSPTLKCWGPPDGRGCVANPPTCGPLLILSPAPFSGRAPNPSHGCGRRAKRCMWHVRFSMMVMPSFLTNGIPQKKRGFDGQPIEVYRAIDSVVVAEWKVTLRKIEEGTSVTWEEFVAFFRVLRVTANGCTCAKYCTFAICEGLLPWLLVKEPNFKVPSQYSWEMVAQRPFQLGCIEHTVAARAEPRKKVRTRQSHKHASRNKKAATQCRRKVVAGSDVDSDADVPRKKALPSAPPVKPPTSKRRTRGTIPSKTNPLGIGDWLTDKDILCWLNQELYHTEIDEPRVWTLAVIYVNRVPKWMQIVDGGSTLDNMACCRCRTFVVNSDDKEGLHYFVCAFDCRARLERFIIWVWEPLSSIHLICPFLAALKKHGLTTQHQALGFQKDSWSCGFTACTSQTWGMFPSPQWVQVLSTRY